MASTSVNTQINNAIISSGLFSGTAIQNVSDLVGSINSLGQNNGPAGMFSLTTLNQAIVNLKQIVGSQNDPNLSSDQVELSTLTSLSRTMTSDGVNNLWVNGNSLGALTGTFGGAQPCGPAPAAPTSATAPAPSATAPAAPVSATTSNQQSTMTLNGNPVSGAATSITEADGSIWAVGSGDGGNTGTFDGVEYYETNVGNGGPNDIAGMPSGTPVTIDYKGTWNLGTPSGAASGTFTTANFDGNTYYCLNNSVSGGTTSGTTGGGPSGAGVTTNQIVTPAANLGGLSETQALTNMNNDFANTWAQYTLTYGSGTGFDGNAAGLRAIITNAASGTLTINAADIPSGMTASGLEQELVNSAEAMLTYSGPIAKEFNAFCSIPGQGDGNSGVMLAVSGSPVGPSGTTIFKFLNMSNKSGSGPAEGAPIWAGIDYSNAPPDTTSGDNKTPFSLTLSISGNSINYGNDAANVNVHTDTGANIDSKYGVNNIPSGATNVVELTPSYHKVAAGPITKGNTMFNNTSDKKDKGGIFAYMTASGMEIVNDTDLKVAVQFNALTGQVWLSDASSGAPADAIVLSPSGSTAYSPNAYNHSQQVTQVLNPGQNDESMSSAATTMEQYEDTWAYYSSKAASGTGNGYSQGTIGGLQAIVNAGENGNLQIFGSDSAAQASGLVSAAKALLDGYVSAMSGTGTTQDTLWANLFDSTGTATINTNGFTGSNVLNQFLAIDPNN